MLHKQRNVVRALAQRWHVDRDHRQAEVQILAERTLLDLPFEILVGGSDDADVDVHRLCRSETLHFAFL
jgi:hypothetical protein